MTDSQKAARLAVNSALGHLAAARLLLTPEDDFFRDLMDRAAKDLLYMAENLGEEVPEVEDDE